MSSAKTLAGPNGARTAAKRRRASDARKRQAGCVRVSVWVPAERLAEIDGLIDAWTFAGRAQVIDVAVQRLVKQSLTATRLEP